MESLRYASHYLKSQCYVSHLTLITVTMFMYYSIQFVIRVENTVDPDQMASSGAG